MSIKLDINPMLSTPVTHIVKTPIWECYRVAHFSAFSARRHFLVFIRHNINFICLDSLMAWNNCEVVNYISLSYCECTSIRKTLNIKTNSTFTFMTMHDIRKIRILLRTFYKKILYSTAQTFDNTIFLNFLFFF